MYICIYVYVCTYVHAQIHTVCMHAHMYVYMYRYMIHGCICVYLLLCAIAGGIWSQAIVYPGKEQGTFQLPSCSASFDICLSRRSKWACRGLSSLRSCFLWLHDVAVAGVSCEGELELQATSPEADDSPARA